MYDMYYATLARDSRDTQIASEKINDMKAFVIDQVFVRSIAVSHFVEKLEQ